MAFTKEMKEIALKYWPEIEHKIVIITQAIETCPSNYSIRKQLALKGFSFPTDFFFFFSLKKLIFFSSKKKNEKILILYYYYLVDFEK